MNMVDTLLSTAMNKSFKMIEALNLHQMEGKKLKSVNY